MLCRWFCGILQMQVKKLWPTTTDLLQTFSRIRHDWKLHGLYRWHLYEHFTADQKKEWSPLWIIPYEASLKPDTGNSATNDASTLVVNLNINCSKTFSPRIKIQINKGTAPLTQAQFDTVLTTKIYKHDWTGTLANNQSQNVTLSAITSTRSP
jgi:hypothetical protein